MAFVMCGTTLKIFFLVISTRTWIKAKVTKTDETKSSPHHVIKNTWTVFPKYSPLLSLSITDWHKPQEYNLQVRKVRVAFYAGKSNCIYGITYVTCSFLFISLW
jgi:hypothetical protein